MRQGPALVQCNVYASHGQKQLPAVWDSSMSMQNQITKTHTASNSLVSAVYPLEQFQGFFPEPYHLQQVAADPDHKHVLVTIAVCEATWASGPADKWDFKWAGTARPTVDPGEGNNMINV